jgi:hypothetical protein
MLGLPSRARFRQRSSRYTPGILSGAPVSHSVFVYDGNLLLIKEVLAIGRYRPWVIALSSAIFSEALGP